MANSPTPGIRVALTTLKVELSEAGLEMELEANLPTSLQKSGQWRALIGSEIILCEGKAEATKKVKILERGAEGSTKISHAATTPVYHILTAEGIKRYIEGFSKEPFATEIGNGSETSFVIKHELSTKRVIVNVYETASPFAEVLPTVKITSENSITVEFLTAPSSKQYTVVVVSGVGPQGPEGKAGLALTYAELIKQSTPVNGWDLQDAAGVGSLAATYGAQALSSLSQVTSGVTTNPLYKGAKAIHFEGGEGGKAETAAAGALTTYKHASAEIWAYLPAETGITGGLLSIGKNSITGEGFGFGVENNYLKLLKPEITFAGGASAEFITPKEGLRLNLSAGWHHFAWRSGITNPISEVELFLDGEFVGMFSNSGETNYGDHTANERTYVGGLGGGFNSPPAGLLLAHAYIYNYRLPAAAIRARSDLVKLLQ